MGDYGIYSKWDFKGLINNFGKKLMHIYHQQRQQILASLKV